MFQISLIDNFVQKSKSFVKDNIHVHAGFFDRFILINVLFEIAQNGAVLLERE